MLNGTHYLQLMNSYEIDISSNNNLTSVPFELIALYMGTISILLVIEIAPWNFLLTYIETDQNGWKTS